MKTLSRVFCIFVLLALLSACGSAPTTSVPAVEPSAVPTQAPTEMVMEPTAVPTIEPTAVPVAEDAFDVSVAQYFLDTTGFHGMATTLAETKAIDTAYLSKVNRVKKVLAQTIWPAELDEQADAFIESLGAFAAVLEADNVDEAITNSETVHDAQHELSHAIDEWAGTAKATTTAADPSNVSVAQYFMDSAGFHGMATSLAETKTIDTASLSIVNRVKKVVVQTVWPTELNEQAQSFIGSLETFAVALEANNVDDAIMNSETVHDAQHDLSHAIDEWAGIAKATTTDADPFNVSVAQYFLDTAGFHGMATSLAETKAIDPTYLSTVNRVKKVLVQTVWPAELNEQAQAFIVSLGTFAAALEADNVEDAITNSETVHDAQHELSHDAIDPWLEANAQNN